jgi:hypothetical protein
MDDDRKWHLAWAQLDAFSNNLPHTITEKHVAEFHAILDLLHEASGEEVSAFRIPDDEVRATPTSVRRQSYSGRIPGHVTYSKEKYCDRSLMLRRIEAVRGYFARIQPPPAKPKYGL